jgi:beta-N-acetylhexosaminidase
MRALLNLRKRCGFFLCLIICLTLLAPSLRAQDDAPAGLFWRDGSPADTAEALLSRMSEEEMCAQVFLVGWNSAYPTPEIMEWIGSRGIGGVKIFGWNGNNIYTLSNTVGIMQKEALATPFGIPLFIATDQEGGLVRHVKDTTSTTPGNMAIGATGMPIDAYKTARIIGRELRAMGINMNFAPTVDVYNNPEDRVIGPRAFSDDPLKTAELGVAYFRGLESSGVISTAKHYPGHGSASGDSHGILPVIETSFDELWKADLLPYRLLVKEGLPAVLSGHLNFPHISGDDAPASLSSLFLRNILRDQLGFEGLIITDDLYMGGAVNYGSRYGWKFSKICTAALLAGNDMIMLSRTPARFGEIWSAVISAYREDPEFRASIIDSVRRILLAKLRYLKGPGSVPLIPDAARIREQIPAPDALEYFFQHSARSVTLIRQGIIPIEEEHSRILLAGGDPDFIRVGREDFPNADIFDFSGLSVRTARTHLSAAAENYDIIIFCLADTAGLEILNVLEDEAGKTAVLSILNPVYVAEAPWIRTAIAVYGWGRDSFHAGFSALKGDFVPEGSLPIRIQWKQQQ